MTLAMRSSTKLILVGPFHTDGNFNSTKLFNYALRCFRFRDVDFESEQLKRLVHLRRINEIALGPSAPRASITPFAAPSAAAAAGANFVGGVLDLVASKRPLSRA
jgi:hypothetical protein